MLRTENTKALKILSEIISSPKLDINNIKLELLRKYMDEKDFKQMFDDDHKIIPKKFKCKKIPHNYYKINQPMKHLQERLDNKELSLLIRRETFEYNLRRC